MSLKFASLAALATVAFGCTDDEFMCIKSPDQPCISKRIIMDGSRDCPNGEDEELGTISYCPQRNPLSQANAYLTFRTDPGQAYATHKRAMGSLSHPQKSVTPEPCVFPYTFDSDNDGNAEKYNTCTKVCTTHGPGTVAPMNPKATFLANPKQGCEEQCSASKRDCQKSRAWCASSRVCDTNGVGGVSTCAAANADLTVSFPCAISPRQGLKNSRNFSNISKFPN